MIPTILHMGLPKTASSTMQEFFHRNRQLLMARGILYPKSLGNMAHRKLLLLAGSRGYGRFNEGYVHSNARAFREKAIEDLRREVAESAPEKVILSCEGLVRASSSTYKEKLRLTLEACGLRVDELLLYLRPQADWRRSVIQQRIKVGIWDAEDLYPIDGPEACGTYGCYKDHIERRAAAFGPKTIKLRLFGRNYFKDGDFYTELRDAFRLPEAPYKQTPPTNESLSDFGCRMLLCLNKSMPRYTKEGRECPRRLLIRKAAAKHLKASSGALSKAALPADTLEEYEKYYRESNEWVRKKFFPEREHLFDRPGNAVPRAADRAPGVVARARQAAQQIQALHEGEAIDSFFAQLRHELLAASY